MSLLHYTLRIGDSALILAQRLSDWCTNGPTLEEDIALTNISLDLFGQANGFLEYASKLDGQRSADEMAFKRDSEEFFNLQITEQENGHFGDTIARQFLYSSFFLLYYSELSNSKDKTLAAISAKSLKEIKYHFRHCRSWIIRLGDGTAESNERLQVSINNIWKFTGEFFECDDIDQQMNDKGIGINNKSLKPRWDELINETLKEAKINRPDDMEMVTGSRKGIHTKHLSILLEEMQYLPRTYPDAKW